MATSDFIAQTAVEKSELKHVDWFRVGRFAFLGLFYVGPSLRLWYLTLDKIYGVAGKTVGIKKVLTDQCMFSPAFIASFLIVCGKSQFHTWNEIKQKINNDYFTILKTSYKLWPCAQLITFYVIPLQLRVPFVSFIALIWNTYLASQANRSTNETTIKDGV
ncbi:protein Mpv17-like isoform X2 [Uloborus diversus]|nr:protein Mpv17-like isoform X2 [Uloborus diversus]